MAEKYKELEFKNDDKHLLYIGVYHEFGDSVKTKAIMERLREFGPEIALLHTVGTLESVKHILYTKPKDLWEETYYIAEYCINNGINIDLMDPRLYDELDNQLYKFGKIVDSVSANLLRKLCLVLWQNNEVVTDKVSVKHCINKYLMRDAELKRYLNDDFTEEEIFLKLDTYSIKHNGSSLQDLLKNEIKDTREQPIILAPYPINKTDIGLLNKFRSDLINEYEIQRIIKSTNKYNKIFSETGMTHFNNQKTTLLRKLGFSWKLLNK